MGHHYKLKDGFSWNPLANFPRNEDCFCKSGKKFKKCCLAIVQPVVATKDIPMIEKALRFGHRIKLSANPNEEHANKVTDELGSTT